MSNSKQLALLELALETNQPCVLWGEPGIGKTAEVERLVKARDGLLYLYQVAQRDPVDLTGAMHPQVVVSEDGTEGTVTRYSTPEWVWLANEAAKAGKFVVIFCDEISTAAPMSLNAMLTLVQSYKAGEYELHPDIRFVMAGNPSGSNAGVYDLPAAFANRVMHIEWGLTVPQWIKWLGDGGFRSTGNETADEILKAEITPLVSAFLKNGGGELMSFPKAESAQGGAWPSPRSWEAAVRLLAMNRASNGDKTLDNMLLTGTVGTGVARSFMAFEKEMSLPDPEEVLKKADKFPLPDKLDVQFVLMGTVTGRILAKYSDERCLAGCTLLARMVTEKDRPDVAASNARRLAEKILASGNKELKEKAKEILTPLVGMLKESGMNL